MIACKYGEYQIIDGDNIWISCRNTGIVSDALLFALGRFLDQQEAAAGTQVQRTGQCTTSTCPGSRKRAIKQREQRTRSLCRTDPVIDQLVQTQAQQTSSCRQRDQLNSSSEMLPNTYRIFTNLGVNNPNNNNNTQNYYYTDAQKKDDARKNRSHSAPAKHIDSHRDCQRGNDGFVSIWMGKWDYIIIFIA